MRVPRSACLLTLFTLLLSACQMMSGLNKLHVDTESTGTVQQPASSDAGARAADADAQMMNASGVGKKGDLGHDEQKQPEPDEMMMPPRTMPVAGSSAPVSASQMNSAGGPGLKPLGRAEAGSGGEPGNMPQAGVGGAAGAEDTGTVDPSLVCMPPMPGGPACTLAPQCGCEMDENCVVRSDRVACVAAGTAGANAPCQSVSDCIVGYQCLLGACMKLCDASRPDCAANAACVQIGTAAGQPIAGANFCESACNLVDPQRADGDLSACGEGLVCVWSDPGSVCAVSERASKGHGELCDEVYECASGFACASTGTCAKWCASDTDCPDAFTCDLSAPVSLGSRSIGTCKPDCLDRTEKVCGLSTQCGCAEDRSCDTTLNDTFQVIHECRVLGSTPLFEACVEPTDCGRRAQCVGRICEPVCLSALDCERYASCELTYFAASPFVPAGATCRRPCDPADPYRAHGDYGECPSGDACEVTSDGRSYCRSASLRGVAGVSCSSNLDCAAGYTCTSDDLCVQLCRTDFDCDTDYCSAFSTAQFATNVEWGYCSSDTTTTP